MKPSQISANFWIDNSPENGVVIKKKKKFFYSSFMMEELDQYMADNYDLLKAEGSIDFHIPTKVKTTNEWTTTDTNYFVIGTFPEFIPKNTIVDRKLEDFDIGIPYKRFFSKKTLTDVDGQHGVECEFYIVFDSSNPEEMELSILTHYESYVRMGIIKITVINANYGVSNYGTQPITMTTLLPYPNTEVKTS